MNMMCRIVQADFLPSPSPVFDAQTESPLIDLMYHPFLTAHDVYP